MNYPIPTSAEELIALRQKPVNEELIAAAIAGVIRIARSRNQSLEQLRAEVLADHSLLDRAQRQWLSDLVTDAWQTLPAETSVIAEEW
jgi:FixJ family two-component response regulator